MVPIPTGFPNVDVTAVAGLALSMWGSRLIGRYKSVTKLRSWTRSVTEKVLGC